MDGAVFGEKCVKEPIPTTSCCNTLPEILN